GRDGLDIGQPLNRQAQHGGMPLVLTSGLESLPEGVEGLFRRSGTESLYQDLGWFRLLAAATGVPSDRCVVAALTTPAGAPMAAIVLERRARAQHFPVAKEVGALANYYTCSFAPALAAGNNRAADVISELVREVAATMRGVDLFDLTPLPDEPKLL